MLRRRLPGLPSAMLGFALLHGAVAAALTAVNGRSGFMSAAWAVAGALGGLITARPVSRKP